MKMKNAMLICAWIALTAQSGFGQQPGGFALFAGASSNIPLGTSATYFAYSPVIDPAAGVSFSYRFGALPLLYVLGQTQWLQLQPSFSGYQVNTFGLAVGVGAQFDILPWLAAKADISGGGFYGSLSGGTNTFPTFSPTMLARAGVDFKIGDFLVELLGHYVNYFTLYQSAGYSLAVGWQFGGGATPQPAVQQQQEKPKPLEKTPTETQKAPETTKPAPLAGTVSVEDFKSAPLFPVFYKYYDDHALGTLSIRNGAGSAVSKLKVSLWIKQYMDGPKAADGPTEIAPGQSARIELFAIFTDKVLEINERTKAQAQIDISYEQDGKQVQQSEMQTIVMLDRNAMTWDDDRRAAAFVSSKDPSALSFAKRTVNLVKKNANPALNENLQIAMGIHEALSQYGIGYVKDPKSASIGTGTAKVEPDFLAFPRQTLEYKSGDCDDLTILYCSLFESVGVDTAFITTPGHIFMAFSPGLTAAEARRSFSRVDDLIILGDKVWVPIEITDRSDFLTSWQTGAREWRENLARKQVNLYDVHDAWNLYEPAGLSGSGPGITYPDETKLASVFVALRDSYVEREISTSVATVQAQIKKTGETSKSINSLGVLYARYGLFDKATTQFDKVVKKEEYAPSLVNLGNIAYFKGERDKAMKLFERALAKSPKSPQVLLALARVNHDVENYYAVKKYFTDLKTLDPGLAEQFSYLDLKGEEASRAADITGAKEVLLWSE
jgi:tetratricopeptide (TPR) repeat protein